MTRRLRGDEGSVMPMTTILITFLLFGAWALVSASQQWNTRRDVYGAAAAAARAAAQATPAALRNGAVLDTDGAVARAEEVLTVAGYRGAITLNGATVTVTITAPVDYAFPSPGVPARVTGTATATVRRGVNGQEAGG